MQIKSEITSAPGITIFQPEAGKTISTDLGTVSIGATVGAFSKGRVGEINWVTAKDFRDILGDPLPTNSGQIGDTNNWGAFREALYHVSDALDFVKGGTEGCERIGVMRVVPSDAEFPTITMASATGAITAGAEAYGTEIVAGTGTVFVLYVVDGDPSTGRSVEVSALDDVAIVAWQATTAYTAGDLITTAYTARYGWYRYAKADFTSAATFDASKWGWTRKKIRSERFRLKFYDTDVNGDEYELEAHTVSIKPTAIDALGRDAFITTVLERDSKRFRCAYNESESDWATVSGYLAGMAKTDFAGGTNGTLTGITSENWTDAWTAFLAGEVPCDLMFMSGNRDPDVISYAAGVAMARRARLFADLNPNARWEDAIAEQMDNAVESRFITMCYCPVSANDPFNDGRYVWGASGAAACAKAKGNAKAVGKMPGIHRAIGEAGIDKISRTTVKFLFPDDQNVPEMAADARINPVGPGVNGGAVFLDALTNYFLDDYLRFQWVNDICSYIDKRYAVLAMNLKMKPSREYKEVAERGMTKIFDECVAAGYLVPPRNPGRDGNAPYVMEVIEEEIDLFLIKASYCPSGCARRQAFQPYLFE